ncbi:alkaline phosphatase [Halalkalibacter wakoensis JCM 9140]|uniref:Alkaline phosphatase n=1 Tax=Halalkalibacter wakoensis JCM 9140 TaxID=1236970 RepID=W4Q9J1_9BACI|nr:alkaline phosphatase [Halalkalibacter wakoensis]GAE28054.1 alkaline phosphatase [Halalkalibacter wakoensis JCM 9140]
MYLLKKNVMLVLCLFVIMTPNLSAVMFAETDEPVKNVILMIPDGFSTSYVTSYRIFKGEPLLFDSLLVGMMKTSSADSWVTDSAAAATAMSTGIKTNNGMIGVSAEGNAQKSILEAAKENGKATGLVTTVAVTDATPAAFGAHVPSRKDETNIAKQLINHVDVLLGGGKINFLPTSNGGLQEGNVIEKAINNNYYYVETREELLHANEKDQKLLGLFADMELTPVIDKKSDDQPSLTEMAEVAIHTLRSNNDGFFLMIEGGQIDRAGHVHDPVWALNEAKAFEETVEKVLEFAKEDKETLVVVAADHDTGGLSVGGYDEYRANIEILRNSKATGNALASQLSKSRGSIKELLKEFTGIELTQKEVKQIKKASKKHRPIIINKIVSKYAYVDWTTHVHSGVDVPVYAYGPKSQLLKGNFDNTDLPKRLAEAMKIDFRQNEE